MIIGTAGHIDHGKTALVRALTGVDTDRLPEEKRRGITLELGFAHLVLSDGSVAGVVDVPGHERFVKAMAAGAGGVDLAILVVALDEGVMPQTREHLDICRLLGVRAGVVAVTKADLLPELGAEWLDLLKADLSALTAETFLEDAPVIPCSAKTGEGIDTLKAELERVAKNLPSRPSEGPAFLPVDRAFTLKGFGTVVTGTLLSGQLKPEEAVSLLPGLGGPLRIRGLQVHGKPAERVSAGQRVAVNLADVETGQVSRGMALTRHGELPVTRMLDVELSLLPAVEVALPKRKKLLLHLGTMQVEATVALLDKERLSPGETALAQLRLAEPVAALPEQRFILRGSKALPGRGATLAGGRILSLASTRRKKGAAELLKPLLTGEPESKVTWLLRQAGYQGLMERELTARSGLSPKVVARALEILPTRGAAVLVDRERRHWMASEVLDNLVRRALVQLEAFHQREPKSEGLSKEELRQKLSPALDARVLSRVLQTSVQSGQVELAGELVRLRGRGRSLTAADESKKGQVEGMLRTAALAPPRVVEVASALKISEEEAAGLLKMLSVQKQAIKVSEDLYFHVDALEDLKKRLVSHLKAHREISTQAFKELVGQSRKFVIPLSEYFDRERVTLRVGEKRVLRGGT